MRKISLFLSFLIIGLGGFLPQRSMAAVEQAQSVVYFDAEDHIIGQQILYCNNVRVHAGTIDVSNNHRIQEAYGCSDPTVVCHVQAAINGGYCTGGGADNSYEVDYFNSALGFTYAQYCAAGPTGVNGTGAFVGHPPCKLAAPAEVNATYVGAFTSGWGSP